jgi:hypothetical protein
MSKATRRAVRLLSMIENARFHKLSCDVKVKTGDISVVALPFLSASVTDSSVRFLVPYDDKSKVPVVFHHLLTFVRRPDCCLIWDASADKNNFSSSLSYSVQGDQLCKDFFSNIAPPFMCVMPVMSPGFFTSTVSHVYAIHKVCVDFVALVSTVEYSPDLDRNLVPLLDSFDSLCAAVIRSNKQCNGFFLNPQVSYNSWVRLVPSPMSSLRMILQVDGSWNVVEELPFVPEDTGEELLLFNNNVVLDTDPVVPFVRPSTSQTTTTMTTTTTASTSSLSPIAQTTGHMAPAPLAMDRTDTFEDDE